MGLFGRKKTLDPSMVDQMSELLRENSKPIPEKSGFQKSLNEYRRLQTTEGESRDEMFARAKALNEAGQDEIGELVAWYGRRISQADEKPQWWVRYLNDHLRYDGMTWHLDASYLLAPSIWKEGVLANTLIYGLGFTPHDPWNRVMMVDNPVASMDLQVPQYDAEKMSAIADEFARSQADRVQERLTIEEKAGDTGDVSALVDFTMAWRAELEREFARLRQQL